MNNAPPHRELRTLTPYLRIRVFFAFTNVDEIKVGMSIGEMFGKYP
jgi:hypothetical protein